MAFLSDIFSRVGRVARGQANAGVDDATFEATVRQTVADMKTELNNVVRASAMAMSNYNTLQAEYDKYVRQSAEWKQRAGMALDAGNEDLARKALAKKVAENAATIKPQIDDDTGPANYYRALRDVAAWMPKNAVLSAEGAGTMDIGLTQLPSFDARSCLNAGTYGTMGVGLGQAIAACVAPPGPAGHPPLGRLRDRLLRHGDGDAGALQPAGQDRRPEQRRHRSRHAANSR